ncbi:hypothetical protein [Ravibacter arvi]
MARKPTKTFLSVILTLSTLVNSSGQTVPDTLRWREGIQLQADDFHKKSAKLELGIFHQYSYGFDQVGFKGFMPRVQNYVVFSRKKSSLGEYATRDELRFSQLMFDLAGLQERKVRVEIAELNLLPLNLEAARQTIEQLFSRAEEDMDKKEETLVKELSEVSEFQRDVVFQRWEKYVRDELKAMPTIKITRTEGFGLGVFFGAATSLLNGKTSDYFTNPTAVNFGFDFDFKRHRVILDSRLGFNRTKAELQARGDWETGLKTSHANIEFAYGYLFPVKDWILIPYAGLAINEFTPRKNDKNDKRKVVGYAPVVGFEFNHLFFRQDLHTAKQSFLYKIKLSYCPNNFIKNYSGGVFSLGASIGIQSTAIKRKTILVYPEKKQG